MIYILEKYTTIKDEADITESCARDTHRLTNKHKEDLSAATKPCI